MVNKQTEGKHNLYIDMLKERQSTMENGRLNTNIPKIFMKASWRQSKKIHQIMKEPKSEFLYVGKYLFKFWALILRTRGSTIL